MTALISHCSLVVLKFSATTHKQEKSNVHLWLIFDEQIEAIKHINFLCFYIFQLSTFLQQSLIWVL